MQLLAGVVSGFMWLAAGYGYAIALDRAGVFPGLTAKQASAAPLLLGLGVALYLLAAALHYMIVAFEASRAAERRALEFEIASREAELRALRAQIHPHFLFNSLNSINALIASRPEEARQLCVRLADFLRRSLTLGSREAIALAEELDLAEQLLAIERVRFGERLSHAVVADERARACPVPPLLLQPLVENAVTHGIAQMLDGGEIRIEAERLGDVLRIVVQNPRDPDAPGRKGTGIGLANVRRRLATLHGDTAEVRVLPAGETFRVELRLPAGR
jgi:LytS/YehU family sensor histidine kinase